MKEQELLEQQKRVRKYSFRRGCVISHEQFQLYDCELLMHRCSNFWGRCDYLRGISFIQQGHVKLIKMLHFYYNVFEFSIHQRILIKMYHDFLRLQKGGKFPVNFGSIPGFFRKFLGIYWKCSTPLQPYNFHTTIEQLYYL